MRWWVVGLVLLVGCSKQSPSVSIEYAGVVQCTYRCNPENPLELIGRCEDETTPNPLDVTEGLCP